MARFRYDRMLAELELIYCIGIIKIYFIYVKVFKFIYMFRFMC